MTKLGSGRVDVWTGDQKNRDRGVGSRGEMVKLDSRRVGLRKETRKRGAEMWGVRGRYS